MPIADSIGVFSPKLSTTFSFLATDGLTDDVCFERDTSGFAVSVVNTFGIAQDPLDFTNFGVGLNAGEVITVTSPEGTFASLVQSESGAIIEPYLIEGFVNPQGRAPDGLVLDIPGSALANNFPAFANVPFPDIEPIEFTIDLASGTVSWTNSGAEDAIIALNLDVVPENSINRTLIQCTLSDDGIHVFADGLIPADATTISSNSVLGMRSIFNTVESGGALLFVSSNTQGLLAQ